MSAQSNTLSKKERVNNIQAFIGLLLVVIGGFLPQIGLITKNGMLVLATFIAVLFGFSKNFSPWYVISAVLLYSIFSGASFTNTIFPAMISNNIIWMIVFTYWFIAAVQESGALRYLTKKLLSMPLAKKGPYGLMFILMIASWIGAALTQSMGGVLLLVYAILQDVANELELEKYNKWTVLTGIGCAIVGCMGNLVLPFGAVTLLYNSLFESTFGLMTMPSDGLWFLTYMLISIFVVAAFIIITKYLVRPNVNIEKFKDLKTVGVGGIKATKQAKIMLAMLVFIILILLLPSVLPSDFIISKICSNIGVTGAFGIGAFVGCFVQGETGDKLFNFNEKAQKAVIWPMILYTAALIYVGGLLNNAETGIPALISTISQPLQAMSPLWLIAVLSFIAVLLTNVMGNFIVCVLLCPIAFNVVGYDTAYTSLMVIMMIANCYTAVALPSASTSAIILHSYKDLFKPSQIISWGYIMSVITSLITILVMFMLKGMYI